MKYYLKQLSKKVKKNLFKFARNGKLLSTGIGFIVQKQDLRSPPQRFGHSFRHINLYLISLFWFQKLFCHNTFNFHPI